MIKIYTDGSSRGNPRVGGFGVVVFNDEDTIIKNVSRQYNYEVTNNQMELEAILFALKLTQSDKSKQFTIYCDSAYCVNICNEWIKGWAQNGWTRGNNEEIKNLDLIKEIYQYINIDFPNYIIEKCQGHYGNIGNELADALATNNQTKFAKILKENNIDYLGKDLIEIY